MSVVYSNFCGMVVSETPDGVESDYVCDPLGSTIGLLNSAGTMTDRWEYWPYGEVISHTGSSVTPLTFLGVIGYFQDIASKLSYVRARLLRTDICRWLSSDPTWPAEPAFEYAISNPVQNADPSGLDCWSDYSKCTQEWTQAVAILLAICVAILLTCAALNAAGLVVTTPVCVALLTALLITIGITVAYWDIKCNTILYACLGRNLVRRYLGF